MNTETEHPVPKVISFEHPFFTAVEGTYFRLIDEADTPVMVTPLETGPVDLKFASVKRELELKDDDPDWIMLQFVGEALRYVKGIRVGDPLPSELHSGEPSWDVTERHRRIAQSRISMQLVTWMSGDEEVVTDADRLTRIADDPTMKEKINEAFGAAAEKLGLGRDKREEVVNLVGSLAEELASIEALRERFVRITIVEDRIAELSKIYESELSSMETIVAVTRLNAIAMEGFRDTFEKLDAQTGEIMAVLKNMGQQVKFIRQQRDDLHRRLWAWDGICANWEQTPARRGADAERMIQETYRFLAQRFLPQKEWELFTKAYAGSKSSETVWN